MTLTSTQSTLKRAFDITGALVGLLSTWWIILIAWLVASIDTRQNGFFVQQRVGKYGRLFKVIKIRTMRKLADVETTVTTSDDPRITKSGRFFRKYKIDELPQLINVLWGDMSFVGPRPDMPGFADMLEGDDLMILSIRPGITGPATIKYREEESMLAKSDDPEKFNREVIWPDKVRINLAYIRNWSLTKDIHYIIQTVFH
jgi:lipopolysaccharide/colanic/teichoic acid biosynthesis glycosyltransferase